MKPFQSLAVLTLGSLLAACAAPPQEPVAVATPAPVEHAAPPMTKAKAKRYGHSHLAMAQGTYHCDLNRRVVVKSVSEDRSTAVLSWNQRNYRLKAVGTASGALRYEDNGSGLTWITVVGKSMLLDTRRGKQLANDCRV